MTSVNATIFGSLIWMFYSNLSYTHHYSCCSNPLWLSFCETHTHTEKKRYLQE